MMVMMMMMIMIMIMNIDDDGIDDYDDSTDTQRHILHDPTEYWLNPFTFD